MTTPHYAISEDNAEGQTPVSTPANSNSRPKADLSLVQLSFDQLAFEASAVQNQLAVLEADMRTHIRDLQAKLSGITDAITGVRAQVAAAAAETLARVDDGVVVTGAPAIILPRELERNRKVPGTQLIYMGVLDHPRVGRPINLFTSQKDFGVMTANQAMERVGSAKSWEGHDGLPLGKGYGYEDRVLEAWKDGRGMDQWVVMPMVVLTGKDYPGKDKIFDGNLFDNRNESDLKGSLNTSGSVVATWFWSCTESRANPGYVWYGRFSDGGGGWDPRDGSRSSVRPCLAQELNHLAL
jgi:hypothetical protein